MFQNLAQSGRAVEISFIESGAFVRKMRTYSRKNAQVLTLELRLTCKLRHVKLHAEMKKVGLIFVKISLQSLRNFGQSIILNEVRGSRNLRQPATSSEARRLRDFGLTLRSIS